MPRKAEGREGPEQGSPCRLRAVLPWARSSDPGHEGQRGFLGEVKRKE
ncbi:hypothetical protein Cadr_000010036 [Camelus dromedarius]|uniref:Uncharacterized protein n=1 Tax=Camelus dromedarius TaxID=9838 RepID=A0A5N4DX04_CAMDR|nr:hypothetical protein Cadr_000010036 [Camelus dromedarius]